MVLRLEQTEDVVCLIEYIQLLNISQFDPYILETSQRVLHYLIHGEVGQEWKGGTSSANTSSRFE